MKSIEKISISFYYLFIVFSLISGSMMEYFGNSYGKFIMIPGIILGIYESYKSDK
jgi:small neutral amino acid transporter SnatA (MarC family)